jgi:hypothetical protein
MHDLTSFRETWRSEALPPVDEEGAGASIAVTCVLETASTKQLETRAIGGATARLPVVLGRVAFQLAPEVAWSGRSVGRA